VAVLGVSPVYDPELDDPESGNAPGTSPEELPDDWLCPEYVLGKEFLELIDHHVPCPPETRRQIRPRLLPRARRSSVGRLRRRPRFPHRVLQPGEPVDQEPLRRQQHDGQHEDAELRRRAQYAD
jgi:rubredoxin